MVGILENVEIKNMQYYDTLQLIEKENETQEEINNRIENFRRALVLIMNNFGICHIEATLTKKWDFAHNSKKQKKEIK